MKSIILVLTSIFSLTLYAPFYEFDNYPAIKAGETRCYRNYARVAYLVLKDTTEISAYCSQCSFIVQAPRNLKEVMENHIERRHRF